MALILSIETGTSVCSAALAREGELVAIVESLDGREHGSKLGLFVDKLLREAGITADELDAVAVGRGPGSYTGLRIGVSLAKGICYGAGIPLIAVDSLAAMTVLAKQVMDNEQALYCPMIDARRMEVYARVYNSDVVAQTEIEAIIVDESTFSQFREQPFLIFGDGAAKCLELLSWAELIEVKPSARGMVALAEQAFAQGKTEDIAYFEPLYLKDFVVIASKKKIF